MGSFTNQLIPCLILAVIQGVAAIPWLWAVDSQAFAANLRRPTAWATFLGFIGGLAVLGAMFLGFQRGADQLEQYGRWYGALLHLQIIADVFVVVFQVLLLIWPKGAAVGLAAFREGIRQPMFWLIGMAAIGVLIVATVMPYFTFGDDYKMMKQICFDAAMFAPVLLGVLASSISIHEEIEGRTAITLMSKPINRRQFLLGKYAGIIMVSLLLTLLIGWFLNWALHIQPRYNPLDDVVDPMPNQAKNLIGPYVQSLAPGDSVFFLRGTGNWIGEALANGLGLVLGFGQVMVLVAVASTLATRVPMAANLLLCLVLFFLGHLAPVMHRTSESVLSQNPNTAFKVVNFLTQVLETITPTLEFFNMGPAIIRDAPIDLFAFAKYVGSVSFYAVVYSAIALLFGLILFEDRDLA